jgi:hypothetical protein
MFNDLTRNDIVNIRTEKSLATTQMSKRHSWVNLRVEYGSEDRYTTTLKVRLYYFRQFAIRDHENSL